MILRISLLLLGLSWCSSKIRKNLLRELIADEEMKMADPLEWLPDWMGNKEAQQAVLKQMRESSEYRQLFYANAEGLSFGEILVILQNFQLEDQRMFLTNEVIARLRPTVFTAFKPCDLPNYPIISFRFVAISRILSEFDPETLILLIERHLEKYSFVDRRLAPWVLQLSVKYQLDPKTWSPSPTAWEMFSADSLLQVSTTDPSMMDPIMKLFLVFPANLGRLVKFRIGVRRVVRLKLILYSLSADFDESSRTIIKNTLVKLTVGLSRLFAKLLWTEREDYAAVGSWIAHLHDQLKGGWWSSGTPHPPPGHLIESVLRLESIEHPKIRFERRWQWPILQLLMEKSGSIPNLASFVESLVVDADPSTIVWDEIAGLCGEIQKFGYLGVWRRMVEAFKRTNKVLYKKMSDMETLTYIDTFEQPEAPSKDCIIQ